MSVLDICTFSWTILSIRFALLSSVHQGIILFAGNALNPGGMEINKTANTAPGQELTTHGVIGPEVGSLKEFGKTLIGISREFHGNCMHSLHF
jgi:hypothetical protein